MNQQTITCPKCGNQIELTKAFTSQIEEKLRKEFNQKYVDEKAKLKDRLKKEAEEEFGLEVKDLKRQLEEKSDKLKQAYEKELELRKHQRELEEREKSLKLELERQLAEERNKIWASTTNIDGVWVADVSSVKGIAMALRSGLIDVARAKAAMEGKSEKMELVYKYLAGQEFRQHVEAIVESFVGMREDLDGERRAMDKIWAKREKQIERVLQNTARLYGDLQGIIGGMLQPIARLELPAGFPDGEEH